MYICIVSALAHKWGCVRTGVVFGYRTEGMVGGWENYYNQKLSNLYYALNVIPVRKKKQGKLYWRGIGQA
jgi:uncharacterized membrane protein YecN with MAPEG domain